MSRKLAKPQDQLPQGPQNPKYDGLLNDLRVIIELGRGRAAAAVNSEIVATYWCIGERIVQEEQDGAGRASYGEQLMSRLGKTLSLEYGRGFAESSLRNMRQFYLTYPNRAALRSELAWTHYRTLMRLSDPGQRDFYGRLSITGRWSSRELERQIASMLYERAGLSRKPQELADMLPDKGNALSPHDSTFRDPYILDFLGLQDAYSERDLETALVRNIERFLLALGSDFCFVGRQRRLTIGGEDYYIDLVFYHRGLRCLVLVDLKIGPFSPADAAQMKLYLNWTRLHDKREGESDPIGLILCGSKNEQVVELLLSDPDNSLSKRIRVSQYLLLNSEEAIKERLALISEAYEQGRDRLSHGDEPPEGSD
ncbi:MAG TPA: PDDEXK nuclease domain-containing protein [Chloroflexia bacterium]|nr:PDDEXK nuclease domain-containing protein [Chloroflexia bacterium]